MIQNLEIGRRGRTKQARYGRYLRTALHLVTTEGLDALTMQRLATEVDTAVGTVYGYFPSKGALVAEVQRAAIERLTESYLLARAEVDARLTGEADPAVTALTRLVAFSRFWVATTETFPEEAQLLQLLMSESRTVVPEEDATRVYPAAALLLGHARACVEDATTCDALDPGSSTERTVVMAAALNGVLQTSKLAFWNEELFDGGRLAASLVRDLLTGWGAAPAALDAADRHIAAIARRGPLAPPVPEDDPR